MNNFAVFILTNNRADKVFTYKSLRKHGYTGKIVLLIDDEDPQYDRYHELFDDQVKVFNKKEWIKRTDSGDNFKTNRGVIYARNANFAIAKEMGLDYFMQYDDDYTHYRYHRDENNEIIKKGTFYIGNLDRVFELMLNYFKTIPSKCITMAQAGDFMGGMESGMHYTVKRKIMNSFLFDVNKPIEFLGRINEDLTTSVVLGHRGELLFTIPLISLTQKPTQQNKGGMTELYLDQGTYVKSFYSVMYQPSAVCVAMMGRSHKRLHHRVSWKNTSSCVIRQEYKK